MQLLKELYYFSKVKSGKPEYICDKCILYFYVMSFSKE